MVRSICRGHGDRINRHEYLIHTALLGSRVHPKKDDQEDEEVGATSPSLWADFTAWLEWRKYIFHIR